MAVAAPSVLRQLTVPRESLRPPSSDSPRVGVAMSLVAHAALIAALALGVHWRTEEPAGVEAELWAATPQIAAPRAEAEPPPPEPVTVATPPAPAPRPLPDPAALREAQIAIEQARIERQDKERREAEDQRARDRREQAERERKTQREQDRLAKQKADQDAVKKQQQVQADQLKREKAELAQKDKLADAQREKLRQEQMRRMNEQLGNGPADSTGTATRDAGPSANYAGRIKARIKPNVVLTDEVAGNPVAEVEVRLAPDGTIIARRILKTSGVKAWDDSVLRAIDRTGILPRDTDGRVPATLVISFRPLE
jgi:colicin import membrane protein